MGASGGARPAPVIYERFLHNPGWGSRLDAPLMSQVNDNWDQVDENGAPIPPVWDGVGSHRRTFVQDAFGNVIAVRDNTLELPTVRISYSPTGEPILDSEYSGADFDRNGGVEGGDLALFLQWHEAGFAGDHTLDAHRFLYRGYQWDDTLKMYHVRHRVYDPARMLWIQRDPLGRIPGANEYAYCVGEPIDFYDPMGLDGDPNYDQGYWYWFGEGLAYLGTWLGTTDGSNWWYRHNENERQERQWRNTQDRDANSLDFTEREEHHAKGKPEKLQNAATGIAEGIDTAVRIAFPQGDAVDGIVTAVDTVAKKPSFKSVGMAGIVILVEVAPGPDGGADTALRHAASEAADTCLSKKLKSLTRDNFRDNVGIMRGKALGTNEQAHHIVAQEAKDAARARDILDRYQIDVHDPVNGLALDKNTHANLHTGDYYRYVTEQLEKAKSKEEAIDTLEMLRRDIESGERPWEKK